MADEHWEEFICQGCGIHVTRLRLAANSGGAKCLECTYYPDWQSNPQLREIFGPKSSGEP